MATIFRCTKILIKCEGICWLDCILKYKPCESEKAEFIEKIIFYW